MGEICIYCYIFLTLCINIQRANRVLEQVLSVSLKDFLNFYAQKVSVFSIFILGFMVTIGPE